MLTFAPDIAQKSLGNRECQLLDRRDNSVGGHVAGSQNASVLR